MPKVKVAVTRKPPAKSPWRASSRWTSDRSRIGYAMVSLEKGDKLLEQIGSAGSEVVVGQRGPGTRTTLKESTQIAGAVTKTEMS